jgi:hypothetical protein
VAAASRFVAAQGRCTREALPRLRRRLSRHHGGMSPIEFHPTLKLAHAALVGASGLPACA